MYKSHSLPGELASVQITQFVRGTGVCTNHTVCQGNWRMYKSHSLSGELTSVQIT